MINAAETVSTDLLMEFARVGWLKFTTKVGLFVTVLPVFPPISWQLQGATVDV